MSICLGGQFLWNKHQMKALSQESCRVSILLVIYVKVWIMGSSAGEVWVYSDEVRVCVWGTWMGVRGKLLLRKKKQNSALTHQFLVLYDNGATRRETQFQETRTTDDGKRNFMWKQNNCKRKRPLTKYACGWDDQSSIIQFELLRLFGCIGHAERWMAR